MRAFGVVLALGVGSFVACASSNSSPPAFTGDDGGNSPDGSMMGDSPYSLTDTTPDQSVMPDSGCASATYEAQGVPAAMLFVLDASDTMAQNNKWANAQAALVAAMDQNAFDSMSIGLLTYPQRNQPQNALCSAIAGLQVYCAVSGLPQVPIQLAGTNKSNMPPGVRSDIYNYLVNNAPSMGLVQNANPAYDALSSAVTTLQGLSLMGKRMIFFITDGGASCTSQDTPQRSNYVDMLGCQDWEDPNNIVKLLKNAHDNPTTPINSFIVGVQGADTQGNDPSAAPYHVRRALSAYALAGSPETAPMGCDGTWGDTPPSLTYDQAHGDPAVACHFDLSTDPSFTMALSNDIGLIRNKLLGCTFVLPTPEAGTVNLGQVNVDYSVNGGPTTSLKKRSTPTDMCTTDGCWDYTPDNKVELIGKACNDVQASPTSKVDIVVGCQTITK